MANVFFMQYLSAHGNTPGPTQRPYLTGAISGAVAAVPYVSILAFSGTLSRSAANFQAREGMISMIAAATMVPAGVIYAAIFKRAANDRRGGWLFGMSYGFLLWLVGPVTLWQLVTPRPFITGLAAIGLFGAQVTYGLVLGLIFPWIHAPLQQDLSEPPRGKGPFPQQANNS
jgi:hypothetical protein